MSTTEALPELPPLPEPAYIGSFESENMFDVEQVHAYATYYARAALAAAAPSPAAEPVAIPEGWKLVPEEITPEMVGAMAIIESSGSINRVPTIGMSGAVDAYAAALAAAPMLNGLTASEPSYRDKAQKLLDAAHDFWQSSSPRVAVRWLSASDDALVIFTRGEYRETLMSNIDKLPGENVTWLIGEADEGPELRYGQRAVSETAETASVVGLTDAVRICPEKDTECGTHLCATCPKRDQGEVPAEPSPSWRSHGSDDGMQVPEASDLIGGSTDCATQAAPPQPPHVKSVLAARCEVALDSIEAMLGGRNGPSIQLRAWVRELSTVDGGPPTGATENRIDRLETELAQARAAVPGLSLTDLREDSIVTAIAWVLAEQDGVDDPEHLIWEGGPMPEPWGPVYERYRPRAIEVVDVIAKAQAAALAAATKVST